MSGFIDFIVSLFWFIVIVAAILGVAAFLGYNTLRKLAENVKEAWSNIGVSIRKQASLVNQLISVVSAHAEGEKLVMLKVSEDASVGAVQQMHQQSGVVLSAVNGMAQRFPDLKANEQYLSLMKSINDVEDRIETQRNTYNAATKGYNIARTSIPHVFYSKLLGFGPAPYLDFDGASEQGSGSMQGFVTDDGDRINELLSKAGNRVREVSQQAGNVAVSQGKQLIEAAKSQVEDLRRQHAEADDTVASGVIDITDAGDATMVAPRAPALIDIGGSASGQRFVLKPQGQIIGRAATADIVVQDAQVSKQHAWIGQHDGRWLLRDHESSNGTYVDGDLDTRITEIELRTGLVISLGHHGDTRFEVSFG